MAMLKEKERSVEASQVMVKDKDVIIGMQAEKLATANIEVLRVTSTPSEARVRPSSQEGTRVPPCNPLCSLC